MSKKKQEPAFVSFRDTFGLILSEESAKPVHDVREYMHRVLMRVAGVLDENDPFIGSTADDSDQSEELNHE